MKLAFPEPERLVGIRNGLQKKFPGIDCDDAVAMTLLDLCEGRLSYEKGPGWFWGACVRNAIRIQRAEEAEVHARHELWASENYSFRPVERETNEVERIGGDEPLILEDVNRHRRRQRARLARDPEWRARTQATKRKRRGTKVGIAAQKRESSKRAQRYATDPEYRERRKRIAREHMRRKRAKEKACSSTPT